MGAMLAVLLLVFCAQTARAQGGDSGRGAGRSTTPTARSAMGRTGKVALVPTFAGLPGHRPDRSLASDGGGRRPRHAYARPAV